MCGDSTTLAGVPRSLLLDCEKMWHRKAELAGKALRKYSRLRLSPVCAAAVCAFALQPGSDTGTVDLPGEASITASLCQTYALGAVVSVIFSVTSLGAGSSGQTSVNFLFADAAGFQNVTVKDPAGAGGCSCA